MNNSSESYRTDETWHRLREWTSAQPPSERLAALVLEASGYQEIDPSHPLGGPLGSLSGSDATYRCTGGDNAIVFVPVAG